MSNHTQNRYFFCPYSPYILYPSSCLPVGRSSLVLLPVLLLLLALWLVHAWGGGPRYAGAFLTRRAKLPPWGVSLPFCWVSLFLRQESKCILHGMSSSSAKKFWLSHPSVTLCLGQTPPFQCSIFQTLAVRWLPLESLYPSILAQPYLPGGVNIALACCIPIFDGG